MKSSLAVLWLTLLVPTLAGCGGSSTGSSEQDPPIVTNPPPVNTAPEVVNSIEDFSVQQNVFFSVDLAGRFSDEGNLQYSLKSDSQSIETWLKLSSPGPQIIAIPTSQNTGTHQITLTATDEQSLSTEMHFLIDVNELESPISAEQKAQDTEYIEAFLSRESAFLQSGIGVNSITAMTHDGIELHPVSFTPFENPSKFSAASKESLHLNLLAKVILDSRRAKLLLGGDSPESTADALQILTQKIDSYEKFNQQFPAFGGFLPWFISEDRGQGESVYPLGGWEDRLPALDNGQFAWSVYLVYKALYQAGYDDLASRYEQRFELMLIYAKTIFYDPSRQVISGESQFEDASGVANSVLMPEQLTYSKDSYALNDPFEGELMVVLMSLFSDDLSVEEVDALWANKAVQTRQYSSQQGAISVIEGWAFSSHEQWKFLILPYLDWLPAQQLFLNAEKVRADFSNQNDYRGFFASAHDSQLNYTSLLGIQAVASEFGVSNQVTAPYATYPMLLSDHISDDNKGLKWLQNVLAYESMVGDYGTIESYDTQTFQVAPVMTWDGKVLTSFAMMKGVIDEMRQFLLADQLYQPFIDLVAREYEKVDGTIEGLGVSIANPKVTAVPINPCVDTLVSTALLTDFNCNQQVLLDNVDVVANPQVSALNPSLEVGQYNDPAGPWDALIIDFPQGLNLTTNNQFSINLLAPVAGILKVKLEGGSSVEFEQDAQVIQTNEWVEYTFDFGSQANENHQKLVIFFNAGVANNGEDQYFIDDLVFFSNID